jgi:hypothetical protein
MVPFIGAMTIDNLKESLQAEQATAVVAKIFDMQYDAMVTTPTGEFVQLISKVISFSKLPPTYYHFFHDERYSVMLSFSVSRAPLGNPAH